MTGGTDHPHTDDEVKVTTHLPNGWVCESSREILPVESYRRGPDPDDGYWASRMLSRERVADLAYEARAWTQGLAWTAITAGLGMALTGWAQHDSALLASGITAVVVAFVPRARPVWVYQVAMTWAMTRGWTRVPDEERPLRDAGEILAKRVRPAVDVRRGDGA